MSRKKITTVNIFSERLKTLIEEKLDVSQAVFSKNTGISQGYLSMVLAGKRGPSAELIAGIFLHYRKYLSWLLTGTDEEEQTIIDVHPKIVPLGEHITAPTEQDLDEYVAVPLVVGKIAAGAGRIIREDVHSFVWVYRPEVRKRTNLVAIALGPKEKSMLPTLTPGSIVIIDRNDKALARTGIYAVRTGHDECAVKRVVAAAGCVLFCSDNLDYPPVVASTVDLEQLIIGRVIWTWKSFL